MAWGRKTQEGPPGVVVAAGVPARDRLAAAAWDELTQAWVLASRTRLAVVAQDGEVRQSRRWLEVDGGAWDPDSDVLRVTWVDGTTPTRWKFTGPGAHTFTDVFRDRVNASVVLVREVDLGPGRRTRVAIRKDLATRELVDQVVPGRGVRPDDHELRDQVAVARTTLRDQTGLPPLGA
ncbi:hypothetical protein [Ornithinimicrobium cavernae]|uniref:hypothetical protein n=1 Tax=Ornithinimicrobium cavernae TaxID=2666047 RepID=UPI0012B17D03|nr:hypothetical protein [Ornithinimicrobium cavernae]